MLFSVTDMQAIAIGLVCKHVTILIIINKLIPYFSEARNQLDVTVNEPLIYVPSTVEAGLPAGSNSLID